MRQQTNKENLWFLHLINNSIQATAPTGRPKTASLSPRLKKTYKDKEVKTARVCKAVTGQEKAIQLWGSAESPLYIFR